MDIAGKILGIVLCIIGLGLWVIDYFIFTAIGALTAWIAEAVGITGMAVVGLQVVGWIMILGLMLMLLIFGLYIIIHGIGLIIE